MIKKILYFLILMFTSLVFVDAKEVDVYLFYSETCYNCAELDKYLEEIKDEYPYMNIVKYEVTQDDENNKLMIDVKSKLKESDSHVPYTVIGTTGIIGFNDTVKNYITNALTKYSEEDYVDIVDVVKNNLDVSYTINYPEGEYSVPILGKIDPKNVSLPLISVVIGLVDGFNPCAMWVLIFLISMLFNMKDKKRMWFLGITFLVTSALVYLVFMLAWLQVAIGLTQIVWVRYIISLIALIGAYININSYLKSLKKDDGCEVVDETKRKKIFARIKKFTTEKSLLLAMVGIIGLAASVNLIELACSSGLPLVYTQILALNDLSKLQYLIYILIYIFFFLIDDIIIFAIAMKTLEILGISTKYTKYSHLIGGIIMLIIALLMAFKPEWLMFNF